MVKEARTEAEKMREVPGIIFVDGPHGRRARVAGTDTDVLDIIRIYRICGEDRTRFYEAFDAYPDRTITIAFHYYRAFTDEIDALLDQEEDAGRSMN